jgi:hypothetical protein
MGFRDLLNRLGLTDGEFAALLALLALVGTVVTTLVRFGFRKPWRSFRFAFRVPERRYVKRSIELWGTIQDPLFRRSEPLEARYIPLPLTSADGDRDLLVAGDEVLGNPTLGNLIILGDAGSGKSTLLKAYAVSVLKDGRQGWATAGGRPRPLPFLVQLRQFAAHGQLRSGSNPLLSYIYDQLGTRFGLDSKEAEYLIHRALDRRRLVVLLDGLDEVKDGDRESVRVAVDRFRTDITQGCPTANARIVLTCRQHNFHTIRDEWVSVVAGDSVRSVIYSLAPLRDADIQAYLFKVKDKFDEPATGPGRYLAAVRDSPTLDMHRIPLVLATSVSYYARRNAFAIPAEIGELYNLMVTEMLTRHDFKEDPGTRAQMFQTRDKERFLREFAAANALAQADTVDFGESFGPFEKPALYKLAEQLAGRLDSVSDHKAFVDEILTHSGLLKPASETRWEFAHRTIQEYLVAQHLRGSQRKGEDLLLEHARDSAWQQVVIFYAGTDTVDQDYVGEFLHRLASQDLALAGHCLRAAKPSNEVADEILDALVDKVRLGDAQLTSYLAALLSTALSPRDYVRERAVKLVNDLLDELIDRFDVFELLGGNVDSVVHLLDALSHTQAVHIGVLVPKVVSATPNDPRLVAPLWRCLKADGIAAQPGAQAVVERLIGLVMDADCLAQLQLQPPGNAEFATAEMRARVYPLVSAKLRQSNLAELLCWQDYLSVDVLEPNRFLQAKRESPELFARAEKDRPRTRRLRLFPVGQVFSGLSLFAALTYSVYLLNGDWQILIRPHGWNTLWWLAAPPFLAATLSLSIFSWAERSEHASALHRYFGAGASPGKWQSGSLPAELSARLLPNSLAQLTFFISSLAYAVALLPLIAMSLALYLAATTAAFCLLVWLPLMSIFDRSRRLYLYRPNEYADMFDDPLSAHWLREDHPGNSI